MQRMNERDLTLLQHKWPWMHGWSIIRDLSDSTEIRFTITTDYS